MKHRQRRVTLTPSSSLRVLVAALTALACLVSRGAAYRDEVLADEPVGYWRLGEAESATTAVNAGSLGPAGNGTPINGVFFGGQGALSGDNDGAAYFDGAQSRIEVSFAPELNTPVFTIEAWARVSSVSAGYRSPMASRDDSPQKGFIFYADPDGNWQFWTGTGAQVGWNVVGGAFVEPDLWAHLVGAYDGVHKLFYVNGVLVGGNLSVVTPNGARVLRIGASATESPVGDFFFVGDIDEVAMYDRVLSPDRVVAHFRAGAGIDPSPDVFPGFAVQPAGAGRFRGEEVTLSAIGTGSLPLAYQWKKGDVNLPGATGMMLHLSNLSSDDGGDYSVEISNAAGSLVSDIATLTVEDLSRPEITSHPRSRTVLPGSTASFTVAATGSTTFEYQWSFNGQDLSGATNVTLTLTNIQSANVGAYRVTVSNPAGAAISDPASLQFPAPATQSYSATILEDEPAGYWRLGESSGDIAVDVTGANDGIFLNGVTLGQPGALAGDADTAAGFAGANLTKVDVAWSDRLNATAFTVSLWAKVTGGGGTYRSPLTSRADFPQRGYIVYADPANVWQFWVGNAAGGWASLSGPAVQNGTYAHLAGVYDGTTLLFYVNGVLAAESAVTLAPNDEAPLRIGAGATEGDGNFFFEGDIDEVAVFDKALGEDRILAHYVAGYPLTTPPTIITQPRSQAAPPGANVTFSVGAAGGLPLEYQWRLGGQDLLTASASSLTVSNISAANAGSYDVVVRNAGGATTSMVATLTIPARPAEPYMEVVRGAGPRAYWRLGESAGEVAVDLIGGDDGVYLDGVTLGVPGAIAGDADTAVSFDSAVSQKIDVPWSDVLNPPVFSAELWARVTGGSGNYRSPLTSRADGPQRGYIFYAEPGNTWQFWSGKGDTSGWDSIPGPAVRPDAWTHLAATYDGATKRFFVNGIEVGISTAAFAINDAAVLRIGGGASEGPGNYFFHGDVDEVAIYDTVLPQEEIVRHYLAGAPVLQEITLSVSRSDAGLVVTWSGGTLESSPAIRGSWSVVADVTSPATITPALAATFYRVRQ
jgi:hypothetical protein